MKYSLIRINESLFFQFPSRGVQFFPPQKFIDKARRYKLDFPNQITLETPGKIYQTPIVSAYKTTPENYYLISMSLFQI